MLQKAALIAKIGAKGEIADYIITVRSRQASIDHPQYLSERQSNLSKKSVMQTFGVAGGGGNHRILTLRRDPMGNIYLVVSIFHWLPVENPEHCCYPLYLEQLLPHLTARSVALTSCLQRSGYLNHFEHKIYDHCGCF